MIFLILFCSFVLLEAQSQFCDCEDPALCTPNSPFSYPNRCAPNLPPWQQVLQCADGSVQGAYGLCACTEGYPNPDSTGSDVVPEPVCIRDPELFSDGFCRCLQRCVPGQSQCPQDHYCVDTCCPNAFGAPEYRCMPCCDVEFNIPTPVTVEPITPEPTTPEPTPEPTFDCDCDVPRNCITATGVPPFTYQSQCPGYFEQRLVCPNGNILELQGPCACTYGYTPFVNREQVCINDPEQFNYQLCQCLRECTPGLGSTAAACPPNHYCVNTCCPASLSQTETTYRCMPCCGEDFLTSGFDVPV